MEKMRNHLVRLNRVYAQLERIVNREQTDFGRQCFSEVSEAANRAENLCHFYENLKPGDDVPDYIDKYVDEYKKLIQIRKMFLSMKEKRLNTVLYNKLELEEVRKILNPKIEHWTKL